MKTRILLFVTAISFSILSCGKNENAEKKTNFIVILADDLGYGDIGAYRDLYEGGDEKSIAHLFTPNLDDLANEGILCTRAYTGSWCAPSRQMLLSGCWVNRQNVYDESFPWMGRRLRDLGYTTGMYGKSHGADAIARTTHYLGEELTEFDQGLFFRGGERGYHLMKNETLPGHINSGSLNFTAEGNEYITDVFTNAAIDFIQNNADNPFLLYLAYTAPHSPLEGKPDDLKTLFPDVFKKYSDSIIRSSVRPSEVSGYDWNKYNYAAMVYSIDRGVGKIMKALKKENLDKNTMIIFTSDNGAQWGSNYPLTGHKWDIYEGGIRVPFIVWSHKINKENGENIYDGLVSAADINPTICSLAGDSGSDDLDGINIMPLLTGKDSVDKTNMFFYREALMHHQVSNAEHLYPGNKDRILLESFIIDDQKYLKFGGMTQDNIYEKTFKLPDVTGTPDPQKKLAESVMFNIPDSQTGMTQAEHKELLDKRRIFLERNIDEFTKRWSGHYASEQLMGGEHSER